MLRADPARDLCLTCHPKEAKLLKKQFVHEPVALEPCDFVDERIRLAQPKLLKRSPQRMCLGCHRGMAPRKGATATHPPAKEECIACHDAHASDLHYQLR